MSPVSFKSSQKRSCTTIKLNAGLNDWSCPGISRRGSVSKKRAFDKSRLKAEAPAPSLSTSFTEFGRICVGPDQCRYDDKAPPHNHAAHAVGAFYEKGGKGALLPRLEHSNLSFGPRVEIHERQARLHLPGALVRARDTMGRLQTQWRESRIVGATPDEASFVLCDLRNNAGGTRGELRFPCI